jgi:hypothetical protein
MRRHLLVSSVVAAAAFIGGPLAASAQAHYYGIANLAVSNVQGDSGIVEVNDLGVPGVASNFITQESWVINTNNSPETWIETGLVN